MFELQPPEPEPEPHSELSKIHLLPPDEYPERAYPVDVERVAQKETVADIVENIEALTELEPGEKDKALYRRGRVWNLPGCRVHLSKYGFFGHDLPKDSHAEKLYGRELSRRVVGMEVHYPATNEAGDMEFSVESYRVDKDMHGEHIMKSLAYNDEDTEVAADVSEKDALELYELLQFLRGNR